MRIPRWLIGLAILAAAAPSPTAADQTVVIDGTDGSSSEDGTRPVIRDLRARPARFCKRHRRCRRPGTVLSFRLSERAALGAQAIGRSNGRRVVKSFELPRGREGRNRIRFLAARLPEGLYLLKLTATDRAGNSSRIARVRFRIVPPPPAPKREGEEREG